MLEQNFLYPGSKTLKNKYGIMDKKALKEKFAHDSSKEMINLRQEPLPDKIDSSYLKYIHQRLFQHTFEWAGHTRDKPFSFADGTTASAPKMKKANIYFASGKKVQEGLDDLDRTLNEKNNLKGLSREKFVEHAAELFVSLNNTHPFRKGNGRAQRMFFEKLGQSAGHNLDFSLVTKRRMVVASVAAAQNGNLAPMQHLFEDISNPEKVLVLNEFITEMRELGLGEKNYRLAVAAQDGITYQGTYRGSGANGFMIDVNGIFVVGNKKHLSPDQLKTLKIGDQISFTAPRAQDLQQTLIPEEKIKPLTEHELAERIRNNTEVQESIKKIKFLCKVVYGNQHAVQNKMPKIKIPVTHENISEARKFGLEVRDFPQHVHKLRGFNLCGLKTGARQHAQENVVPLSLAIMDYFRAIEHAQKDILEDHQREQERCAKPIEMPSVAIKNLFSLSKEQREAILSESPELREEVRTYTEKLEKRLSPNERSAIKENTPYRLAKSIGTSENKAKEIRETFMKMQELRQDVDQMHLSFQNLDKSLVSNMHQPTKEHTETVGPSAIKATKVTTVVQQEKARQYNVLPPKVERQRAMTI